MKRQMSWNRSYHGNVPHDSYASYENKHKIHILLFSVSFALSSKECSCFQKSSNACAVSHVYSEEGCTLRHNSLERWDSLQDHQSLLNKRKLLLRAFLTQTFSKIFNASYLNRLNPVRGILDLLRNALGWVRETHL